MLKEIHEHTVDVSLLPEGAKVLDIGCRNFAFTNAMRKLGHVVWPVDIDEFEGKYHKCAIGGYDGYCGVKHTDDPQATSLIKNGDDKILCYTLETYTEIFGDGMWDLIKMDVEGSEYDIIMSLTKPPAKQISCEFHIHTGCYDIFKMNEMENKLKELGYEFVSHELSDRHCAGENYWDSLFCLSI